MNCSRANAMARDKILPPTMSRVSLQHFDKIFSSILFDRERRRNVKGRALPVVPYHEDLAELLKSRTLADSLALSNRCHQFSQSRQASVECLPPAWATSKAKDIHEIRRRGTCKELPALCVRGGQGVALALKAN